jgi:hypothetical protein
LRREGLDAAHDRRDVARLLDVSRRPGLPRERAQLGLGHRREEHQRRGAREVPLGDLDQLVAAQRRHVHVDEREVGLLALQESAEPDRIIDADDVIRPLERILHELEDDRAVVENHDLRSALRGHSALLT